MRPVITAFLLASLLGFGSGCVTTRNDSPETENLTLTSTSVSDGRPGQVRGFKLFGGLTQNQVLEALGEPVRRESASLDHETADIWIYTEIADERNVPKVVDEETREYYDPITGMKRTMQIPVWGEAIERIIVVSELIFVQDVLLDWNQKAVQQMDFD